MRLHVFACSAALLLATSSSLFLHAQFQEPTKEELQMTSDPKAPGAAAVYLYREETTDDTLHFHGYYERLKVLTEKGKEQATIRIPYEHGQFKVTDIKGRTIHADGTIIPLNTKPSDLVDTKAGNVQVNTMVFTLPSVEVGSILEYRLQLRYDDNLVSEPKWRIQQPFLVHKAHYFFNPAPQGGSRLITDSRGLNLDKLMYAVTSVPLEAVVYSLSGRYSVDLSDIPPTPNEDWMPPLNTINQRVEFYYTYVHSGADFWQSDGKRWAKETDHFANPTDQLKKAVAQIVLPADSEDQKARKIYAAVMKLENTDFGRRKSEAERKAEKLKTVKDAEDVWTQQSGTGDQIALLYVALARAAGLKVWPMQVVDRSRAMFDPRYLNATSSTTISRSSKSPAKRSSSIQARKCALSASSIGNTPSPAGSALPTRARHRFSPSGNLQNVRSAADCQPQPRRDRRHHRHNSIHHEGGRFAELATALCSKRS
jgi:hypothetical protein